MTEEIRLGIYGKILEVMKSVKYLPKDGTIEFGKTKYGYLSAEEIVKNIRVEMIKQKLIIFPTKTEVTNQTATEKDILVTYNLADAESGSYIEIQVPGGGCDSSDKKTYKAMTGAFKYALRQTFMIETGDDDPDKTPSGKSTGNPGKKTSKKLTDTQIKNLFVEYHDGDKEEAKSDYDIFVDLPEEQQQDIISKMLSEVKK